MRAKGVLDAGADLAVGGVGFFLPGWEFGLAGVATVRVTGPVPRLPAEEVGSESEQETATTSYRDGHHE